MTTNPAPTIASMIDRWTANGTITAAQAERMRADLASAGLTTTAGAQVGPAPAVRGSSLVTEALGYLGGIIILVASGLVVGWFWEDMSTAARLVLVGAVAVLLLIAGAVVSRRPGGPGDRLRSVLWWLTSAAVAGFLALLFDEVIPSGGDEVLMLTAGGTAVVSSVLWAIHPRVLQHIATFAPLVVAVGVGTQLLGREGPLPSLAIIGIGAIWAVLAFGSILETKRQGVIAGAIAMAIGAMIMSGNRWGTAVSLLTVAGLVAGAILLRDLLLLVVAAAGLLVVLPVAMSTYFSGVLGAALALLLVGVVLIGAAIVTARRRRERPPAAAPDRSQLPAGAALGIAVAIAAIVVAVIAASPVGCYGVIDCAVPL